MAFDWNGCLGSIIESHDILGTIGCKWPQKRQTLLIEPFSRHLTEDLLVLEAIQYFPEGLGFDLFGQDLLEIPGDKKTDQFVTVQWDSNQKIPCGGRKHFIYNVAETHALNGPMFVFHEQSMVFTLFDKMPGPIRMVEFFSGGFGGWKRGASQLSTGFKQSFNTIGLEIDLHTAATYAISHYANLVCDPKALNPEIFRQTSDDWVFCCDIWDDSWLPCITTWSPELAVISAPCKPWSGASTSPGLHREDGQLLIRAILSCRFFRPRCIAIEQVPGFSHHPHKFWVLKALLFCGYRMAWSKVVDLQDHSPTSRPRWLGVAVRIHDQFPEVAFNPWKKQQRVTPEEVEAIMSFTPEQLLPLHVSESAYDIASDPCYYKGPPIKVFVGQTVIGTRVYGDHQCLPTFMAMYGSQHCFDSEYLKKHGFFGHFKQDPQCPRNIRYWHPIEIALIHGITSPCFLEDLMAFSWMVLGNLISQPHALLVLTDVCNRMRGQEIAIDSVIADFQHHRFHASDIDPLCIRDGTLWLSKSEHPLRAFEFRDPVFHLNIAQLLEHVHQHVEFQCWTPKDGVVRVDHFSQMYLDDIEGTSEISRVQISPTLPMSEDTSEFKLIQWMTASSCRCSYQVKGSTSIPALVELWGQKVELQLGSSGFHFKAIESTDVCWPTFSKEHALMVVLNNGEFWICPGNVDEVLLTSHSLPKGPDRWFDLYDQLIPGQIYKPGQFVCDFPIRHGHSFCDAPFTLAAAQQTECRLHWSVSTDSISLQIQGVGAAVFVMLEFWGKAILEHDLHRLGRKCLIHQGHNSGSVIFTPVGDMGACPPSIFREILCLCATRVLMDSITCSEGLNVLCKWQGRPLWLGLLPRETTLATIIALVRLCLSLIFGSLEVRLVHAGQNQNPDTFLSDLQITRGRVTLHVVHELSGGGPTKQQTRTLLRNSLASIFLEQGHDIQWVSGAVDSLVNKIGIPKLQSIVNNTSMATKISALNNCCSEIDLKVPGPSKITSQLDFSGAPWNKKKPRKDADPIKAMDFTITPGFFQNEDGSNAAQLSGLRAQACGVCILDPPSALEWLRGNNCISSDELGAFVIGQLPCETKLPVSQITAPCLNANGHSVLLSGRFVQFGAKTIKFCQGNKPKSQPENCHLLAITVLKDDWGVEQWTQATHNPVAFVKKILSNDGQDGDLIAVWGRSLRQGRAPSSPLHASSLQVHCTIASTKIDGILRTSGFNRLYMTPKDPTGKLDLEFKILWVEGSLGEATAIGARLPDCLGLVKANSPMDSDLERKSSLQHGIPYTRVFRLR